jgi:signal transduction histidine kinase
VLLFRDATAEHDERAELAAFAGVVAHDLRNPLAAIDGWMELLEDEALSGALRAESVLDYVGRVRSSSSRMHGLILHLLAHATSRDASLQPTRCDVAASVARIAAARDAGSVVSCREVPPVSGDPVLVEQLLENLIGNALKYVAPGVPPRVEVWGRTTAPGWVTVAVADNGIGLPPGEHRSIFEEFHRAHGGDFEGTGLGLSIARRIVERHGGTITARDNPTGQGTVFEFTLPAYDDGVPHPTPVATRGGGADA